MKNIITLTAILLTIGTAHARREFHVCTAICAEKVSVFNPGSTTFPFNVGMKTVMVTGLGKDQHDAVEKIKNKCKQAFGHQALIAGGISYGAQSQDGIQTSDSEHDSLIEFSASPFHTFSSFNHNPVMTESEVNDLNCDSIRL